MVDGLIASRQGCAWESGLQRRYDTCLWDPGGDTSVTSSASAVNENECLYSRCSVSCYLECASGSRTCWTLGKKLVWYAFREPSLRGKTYSLKMSKCYNGGLSRLLGFSGGSDSKESACNVGDPNSKPRSGWSPWRRKWQPTAVFLPGKSHGQRSLTGYSSKGHKESDTTEWLSTAHMEPIQSYREGSCVWIVPIKQ